MNVLVYDGEGTSAHALKQTLDCLKQYLGQNYMVSTVCPQQLLKEPWMPHTAMLVVPGGADLPYCRALNGSGNKLIETYVKRGGKYLGICAGAYYASANIEFEVGTTMEVSGPRELGFYSGTARGTVFKGFQYGTEKGARAAKLQRTETGQPMALYYNGGCLFEGDSSAEVLARYVRPLEIKVTGDENPAAVVFKRIGLGSVLLSGVHFEYDDEGLPFSSELKSVLPARVAFITDMFTKLQLKVSLAPVIVPELTPLYLSGAAVSDFMTALAPNLVNSILRDKHDTFRFFKAGIPEEYAGFPSKRVLGETEPTEVKPVYVYDADGLWPLKYETPHFDHSVYFNEMSNLIPDGKFTGRLGSTLLYGEVVTSTSSMLERNPVLLKIVPRGLVAVGTQQIAGRGRGANAWVNPVGGMAVSGIIRVPRAQCAELLVFVQYICALAVIKAVRTFVNKDIGLRLKWPNDIYIKSERGLEKVGGILVSCSVVSGEFVIVFGSGTNVSNEKPTTSINSRITELDAGQPIQIERLLPRFLTTFDTIFHEFLKSGFAPLSEEYYDSWLHNNAEVTLERYGNVKATIKEISLVTGMLIAEDASGRFYELQPDGNSFDMMRGLLRCKK